MTERKPYESAPTTRIDAAVAPTGDVFKYGDIIDETYEIRGLLGEGGMGQVYEAFDQRLNRVVAIKVAWPTIDITSVRKEARALAAIRHPCVLTVFAAGEHNGTEYIVMERILGVTLETHIRRRVSAGKPFAFGDAIEILVHVAEALAVVHKAGIAHRDVKPDNVMLAPGDRTVLMDFGVFVPEFEAAQHSGVSGSPAYMAPETISGTIGTGGGFLVDVYSFGVLAFELLTGELPFPGATPRDVLLKHLSADVPRVRDRRLDVSGALDELVHQLMAKDPFERPQGMDEIVHRLKRMATAHEAAPVSRNQPPSGRLATGPRIAVQEIPMGSDDRTTQTRRKGGA
jgi:eukaryotic-like serine/threonine-protein kinase